MTDVKRLLDEATPLPWKCGGYGDYGHSDVFGCNLTDGEGFPVTTAGHEGLEGSISHADAELIVYAVNHLPDYEAAVDALEQCNRALALRPPDPTEVDVATAAARAALARLRGKVAADV